MFLPSLIFEDAIIPSSLLISAKMPANRVDFPLPTGPTIPTKDPLATEKFMFLSWNDLRPQLNEHFVNDTALSKVFPY